MKVLAHRKGSDLTTLDQVVARCADKVVENLERQVGKVGKVEGGGGLGDCHQDEACSTYKLWL